MLLEALITFACTGLGAYLGVTLAARFARRRDRIQHARQIEEFRAVLMDAQRMADRAHGRGSTTRDSIEGPTT